MTIKDGGRACRAPESSIADRHDQNRTNKWYTATHSVVADFGSGSCDKQHVNLPCVLLAFAGLQADNEAAIPISLQEGCRRSKQSSDEDYYSIEDSGAGLNLHFRVPAKRCSAT